MTGGGQKCRSSAVMGVGAGVCMRSASRLAFWGVKARHDERSSPHVYQTSADFSRRPMLARTDSAVELEIQRDEVVAGQRHRCWRRSASGLQR